MTLLRTFLTTIADAGRDILDNRRRAPAEGVSEIDRLCRELMSQKGEALGTALAREAVQAYEALDDDSRLAFFRTLRDDYAPDGDELRQAVQAYSAEPTPETAVALAMIAEAPRQDLLRKLNMAPGGTSALVEMRKHLLDLLRTHPELGAVDSDFVHLLASWFNRGFLEMKRISWRTPANILEEIIRHEAVHEIRDWDDLHRRLDKDRRCYGFFHPALPDEPLIFVEVALVQGLATSIQVVLDDRLPRGSAAEADTAIFYSISNCQRGLTGVSFGNFLIKQVVAELSAELPNLKTFATLSPVPGFGSWLAAIRIAGPPLELRLSAEDTAALDLLDREDWHLRHDDAERIKEPLVRLCAHFLTKEKKGQVALDAVARFHLGNGARLESINWLGDVSVKGLAESMGLMVNYLYDPRKIERYHEAYANQGTVACSRAVAALTG